MLDFIAGLLLPKDDDPASPAVRARTGSRCGILGICANAALFGAKLAIGTVSGSVSITADAMNNLSDASAAIVTWLGFRLARMPADEHHPYGHARIEYLSGLAVAVMILVIGLELMKSSVEKILHPGEVVFSAALVVVLVLSIGVKLGLAAANKKLGNAIHSSALLATAADSRNDCVATSAVLLSAVIGHMTNLRIDGWMGLGVGAFIVWSGWGMAKETISPLLGENADPELLRLIVAELGGDDRILGWHDLMVHDYGPGQRFASVHVEMDLRQDPLLCHTIIDNIERLCLEKHRIHLVIHYDPVVTDDAETNEMKARLSAVLDQLGDGFRFHDFRMVAGDGHINLIFDLVVPKGMENRRREIRGAIEERLSQDFQRRCHAIITFDSAAFNSVETPEDWER